MVNLRLTHKIFIALIFSIVLPFLIIVYFISFNTQNVINKKLQNELIEKEQYVRNFIDFQNKNFKKILFQLSYSKEIISIFNNAEAFNSYNTAIKEFKSIISNLDFDNGIIFNSDKSPVIIPFKSKINFPEKFLNNKINLFYIKIDNSIFLIGTSPLYLGSLEKIIYGYIALIKKIDKKYLQNIAKLFNICCLKIYKKSHKKTSGFKLKIGETITGEDIILSGKIDNSFYTKVKKQNLLVIVILITSFFIFSFFIIYFLSFNIAKPINYFKRVLENIISGKLTLKTIKYRKRDEFYDIVEKLNVLFFNLKNIFHNLFNYCLQNKENIKSLSEHINFLDTNKNSLESKNIQLKDEYFRITSNIDEIKKINNNIEKDFESNLNLFDNIKKLSDEVVEISNISNITFKEINRNSEEIKNLLTSISDISAQINLLSVNASIEAIKSGDVGSGFSVVADEIKSLAETTKDFVENIQKLIENNYHIVKQGLEYSNNINLTLTKLDEYVEKINDFIKDFTEKLKKQHKLIEVTEKNVKQPYEIYSLVENILNNMNSIINEAMKKINEIQKINEESLKELENYVEREKNDKKNI